MVGSCTQENPKLHYSLTAQTAPYGRVGSQVPCAMSQKEPIGQAKVELQAPPIEGTRLVQTPLAQSLERH